MLSYVSERIEAEAKQRKSKPRCAYCRKKLQLPANRYPVCRLSKAMKEQCSSLVIQRKESRPQKIATKTGKRVDNDDKLRLLLELNPQDQFACNFLFFK